MTDQCFQIVENSVGFALSIVLIDRVSIRRAEMNQRVINASSAIDKSQRKRTHLRSTESDQICANLLKL
jgi:hypothetical protein